MSATIIFMGRPTADPVMQQAKNTGTEYMSLDFAVTQRNQKNTENETIYYQCFFNSFQASRLEKAGVKKGVPLMITGSLDIHPFLYQKGEKAGQAGVGAKVNVMDWKFCLANNPNGGAQQNGSPAQNNGNASQGGGANAGAAGTPVQQMQGAQGQQWQGSPNQQWQGNPNQQWQGNPNQQWQGNPNQQWQGNPTPPAPGQPPYNNGFQNIPQSAPPDLPFA